MVRDFLGRINHFAMKSLLLEVSATPKPGLVDRLNSGAHRDMDFFTFIDSAAALSSFFYRIAEQGYTLEGSIPSEHLLSSVRSLGVEAERSMFAATDGVNTHKGAFFLLGLISFAAGVLLKRVDREKITSTQLLKTVKELCAGIVEHELDRDIPNGHQTNGYKLYKSCSMKGVRGEAQAGFPTVQSLGLPMLRKTKGEPRNERLIKTLLSLMTGTDDTTIVSRHDRDTLSLVQKQAREVLENFSIRSVEELDREFILKNISPGGSADLLAVSVMLSLFDGELV